MKTSIAPDHFRKMYQLAIDERLAMEEFALSRGIAGGKKELLELIEAECAADPAFRGKMVVDRHVAERKLEAARIVAEAEALAEHVVSLRHRRDNALKVIDEAERVIATLEERISGGKDERSRLEATLAEFHAAPSFTIFQVYPTEANQYLGDLNRLVRLDTERDARKRAVAICKTRIAAAQKELDQVAAEFAEFEGSSAPADNTAPSA